MQDVIEISVVVPCHKWDQFASKALNSVLNDTTFSPRNHEIILVANGSAIFHYLNQIQNLPFVTVIYEPEANISTALNIALTAARGQLIVRFDADDIWINNRFLELSRYATQKRIFGTHSNFIIDDEDTRIGARNHMRDPKRFLRRPFRSLTTHPCIFFSKDLTTKINYKPEYAGIEDVIFMHDILTNEKPRIIFLEKPLVGYRQHQSQTTAKNLDAGKLRLAHYYHDKLFLHERALLSLSSFRMLQSLCESLLIQSLRFLSW